MAMGGNGFSSDNTDKYYISICGNTYTKYSKCHITIDFESKIILHSQAVNAPRNDMKFAMVATRTTKYKPTYILADKAFDSEKIKTCINEEIGEEDQIPTRGNSKKRDACKKSSIKNQKRNILKEAMYL